MTDKKKLKARVKELLEVTESIVEKENQLQKLKEDTLAIEDQINYLKVGRAKIQGELEVRM